MTVSHPTTDTSADDTDSHQRAELWMREQSPDIHGRQQTILTQLQTLTENGIFTDLSVHTWSTYIGTAPSTYPDGTTTPALDKASEFETWADQNGHSLPGFRRREQSSVATDTTREVIVPPMLCLAVYEDDTLREVSPCSESDSHRTITEHLESLTNHDASPSTTTTNKR